MVNHGNDAQKFFHRVTTQEDVLAHGTGGDGLKLLVNHGDAFFQGIHGVVDGYGLTIDFNLPFIHLIDTKHTLHQRGFTGTVFAHQGVNLTGMKLQLGMIQCFHAGK